MKRIFFSSTYYTENGPSEVNRNLVENFPKGEVCVLASHNRFLIRLETIIKIIFCKVVIISAIGQKDYEVRLAIFLRKKIIYIMHGFAEDDSEYLKARQDFLLPKVDLILCVSNLFKQQVLTRYPDFKDKLDILYNGIAWERIQSIITGISTKRNNKEIILIGGGRPIKNNLTVCRAIKLLNETSDVNLHVTVYGNYNDNDESRAIAEYDFVSFAGIIPHEKLLTRLCSANLLVQASFSESFGLAVVEALACGCNIIVSQFVGAIGIIPAIEKDDIIQDPDDIKEIAERIQHVLQFPNNKRLIKSIDKNKTSLAAASIKLVNIAKQMYCSTESIK